MDDLRTPTRTNNLTAGRDLNEAEMAVFHALTRGKQGKQASRVRWDLGWGKSKSGVFKGWVYILMDLPTANSSGRKSGHTLPEDRLSFRL